ncbi:hypothetical protein [Thiomicrospira sp. WB1]|uniref:hypothetical protein n=1 Tax=Thiomicrospira sp. WB1 TaxID=1685380 RepID=UPI0007498D21|nr:hypothetical protein [Thiomicrospira sp. WB1]KUJ73005.1 hypothetical protein AVO41_04375 [Thiomicrospira sp. WB1]
MQNRSNKPIDLYLVSSPLHFFWAWLLADRHKEARDAHLWLIDQYTDKPMAFTTLLDRVSMPFVQWQLLAGREAKGWVKWRQRKERFAMTEAWCAEHRPASVLIGNDRSVLGQFVLKTAKQMAEQQGTRCTGVFLDDGVFSYLGRAASKSWSERWVDNAIKKLMFGRWYDTPQTVGASRWVDEAWLMFPKEGQGNLSSKRCLPLMTDQLQKEAGLRAFEPMAEAVLAEHDWEAARLERLDGLFTLPNHRIFKHIEGYRTNLLAELNRQVQQGKRIAVKYHPAAGNQDLLGLKKAGFEVVPSNLSFEVLLPFLGECEVVGDFSTTILLAQYLTNKPVRWMASSFDDNAERMKRLCQAVGIEIKEPEEDKHAPTL